jgi:hypothetical protein
MWWRLLSAMSHPLSGFTVAYGQLHIQMSHAPLYRHVSCWKVRDKGDPIPTTVSAAQKTDHRRSNATFPELDGDQWQFATHEEKPSDPRQG